MSDTSQDAGKPPKLIIPGQPEPPPEREPEFPANWDKPAPTAPPGEVSRGVPDWALPISDFLAQLVSDEGLVMDLCLEKAIEIVDRNYQKGIVGVDHFGEGAGGGVGPTRPIVCGIAGPIAIRLYDEVLKAVNGPKKTDFERVVSEATRRKKAADESPEGT
jgi:hypothetical protein